MAYFVIFLFLFLGLICLAASMTGMANDKRWGYGLAVFFLAAGILSGVCMLAHTQVLLFFIIGVPFGGFMLLMGLNMAFEGLRYSRKSQGEYITVKKVFQSKSTEYYALIFRYQAEGRLLEYSTGDNYRIGWIKRRYRERETYPIWINPKKTSEIRVKRFQGTVPGILAVILGAAIFGGLFDILISLT